MIGHDWHRISADAHVRSLSENGTSVSRHSLYPDSAQGARSGDFLMKSFLKGITPYSTGPVQRCRGRLALSMLFLTAASASSACAQAPATIIEEFGLFGSWADDCNAKPSATNPYAIFQLTSRGSIELRNDFGPDYGEMVYRVVDAQRLSYFRLALRQLLTTDDEISLNVVMIKANGRIRVWSSYGADGSTFVENGAVPSANDRETSWMARCNVKWTSRIRPVSEKSAGNPKYKKSLGEGGRSPGVQRPGSSGRETIATAWLPGWQGPQNAIDAR
jgi:hypothetical protein